MPIMRGLRNKGAVTAAFLVAAVMFSAFRTDTGKMRLHGIITPTDKTVISYNADKSVAKLVSTHQTSDESYTVTRIPVYENGKLVRTMLADDAGAPTLFSKLTWSVNNQVIKVSYYENGKVNTYDSLVYKNGKIAARYFFIKADGKFQSQNCQLYTWDEKGNVTLVENMGRLNDKAEYTLSSSTSYKYDNKANAQLNIPAYLVDITPAYLSANNVVAETITVGDNTLENSYEYEYDAMQYPVSVTAKYGNEVIPTKLEWAE
jgi:hypothetical protein